jgi:phage protein D
MPDSTIDSSLVFEQFTPTIQDRATAVLGFNPFLGSVEETNKLKAWYQVLVNGQDVSPNIEPHLVSLRIVSAGQGTCDIELDDRDGKLPIPPPLSKVVVSLGWSHESMGIVFKGVTWDVEHGGDKKQGRRLWIHANAADMTGPIKNPMQDHMGDGAEPGQLEGKKVPFMDWSQQVGKSAGLDVNVHHDIANQARDYWSQSHESPLHHFQRMANDFGAVMQTFDGNKVDITKPGENVDGSKTETIVVRWGPQGNLIGWRVRPFSSRGAWGKGSTQNFNTQAGQWKQVVQSLAQGTPWQDAKAVFSGGTPAATEGNAEQQNEGDASAAKYEPGYGRIVFNGNPKALWNKHILLQGVRDGVNGSYLIITAEHIYDKQGGYITWCDVQIESNAGGGNSVGAGYPANIAPNIVG